MKKTKLLNSMSFKISARIAIVITVIMAVIGILVSVSLTKTITDITQDKITLLADKNSRAVAECLNSLEQKASTLSSTVKSYSAFTQLQAEKMIKGVFTEALADTSIFGVYVALEPLRFFPGSSNGYSFYAYRSETGEIIYENYDYPDYYSGEFYTVTKDTLKPAITEPYAWTLTNGQVVWLITVSVPLLNSDGEFLGVVNCDIAADTLNNLSYDNGGYQKSYSYILTEKGNYVTHSTDKTKSGTAYNEAGNTDMVLNAAKNGEEAFFEDVDQVHGGTAFKVQVPIIVKGVPEAWSSAFVVDKGEALTAVRTNLTNIILLAGAGIVLLVAFTSLFIKRSIKPVRHLVAMASEMEQGKLTSDIHVKSKDELGTLSISFNNTIATLNGYVTEISRLLDEISDGKLTGTVNRDYDGDFKPIKNSLLLILSSLKETFTQINTVAEQVSDGSSQVASGAQTLASGATEQASTIEQLSASVANVSADVNRNAENVNLASAYIDQAGNEISRSNAFMADLLKSMQAINESSTKISAIIKIIDDISFQTNILALNAAVEAARAGQAGKGFSVVAEEVRHLASKSADAAKQTSELINNSIASIREGLRQAESTATSLQTVAEKAQLVVRTNEQIREASGSQAQSIREIELGLQQVSSVVQTISAAAQENAAASQELSAQAQLLFEEASKFKTTDTAATGFSKSLTGKKSVPLRLTD